MSVRVIDKLPVFNQSVNIMMELALKEGAREVLIKSKNRAPFDKGGLRGQTDAKRQGQLSYRISYYKEYARFQEFGGDRRRTVRNYSTAGTGAHFLRDSGDEVSDKINHTFKKYGKRATA